MQKTKSKFFTFFLIVCLVSQAFLFWTPKVYASTVIASQTFSAGTPSQVFYLNADYATAHDASVAGSNTSSISTLSLGQHYSSSTYKCYRYLSTFDTSALSAIQGFSIINATWCMYVTATDIDGANFSVTVQVRNASAPSAFPHQPLWKADYDYNNWTGNLGTYDTSLMTTNNVYYNITLNDNSIVSTSGNTYILARSSLDISRTTPVGTYDEWISVDNPLLTVFYSYTVTSIPQYDISTLGHSSEWVGQSCAFSLNWSSAVSLVGFYLETNNTGPATNETWTTFSSVTWSNKSITLNSTADIVIQYRFHANNTDGGWNSTGYFTFLTWTYPDNIRRTDMGNQIAGVNNAIYYNATTPAIYFTYSNSSFNPWKFQCRAYDLNAQTWTTVQNIGNVPANDLHWRPSISVLPDGRLIVFYAYGTSIKYRVSTYNASTSTNLTQLISNWDAEASAEPSNVDHNYPDPFRFDDRIIISLRNGGADSGNFSYIKYPTANIVTTLWATTNTSRKTEWQVFGASPYLDSVRTSGIYLYNQYAYKDQGDFSFQDMNDTLATIQNVTFSVFRETSLNNTLIAQNLYVYNGTWVNVGTLTDQGENRWINFTVTNTLPTVTLLNNATFYISGKTQNSPDQFAAVNITQCALTVNYTGFGPVTDLVYFGVAGNASQSLYTYGAKYGNKILFTYSYYDYSVSSIQKDCYFFYTDDKGDTFKRVNGSALTLPIQGDTLFAVASAHFTRNFPVLDENNKPLIVVKHQPAGWSEVGYDWQVKVAVYSSTLGSVGTWTLSNVTDQNNANIFGLVTTAPAWMDATYNRPTFWCSGNQSNYCTAKYVRYSNSTTQFKAVLSDTANGPEEASSVAIVYDAGSYVYECLTQTTKTAIGVTQHGASTTAKTLDVVYGTKFVCTNTTTISGARLFLTTALAATEWQCAIYDASFTLQGASAKIQFFGSTITTWGWSASFTTPVSVFNGFTYYVFFRTSGGNQPSYFYDASATVNESCSFSLVWANDFPATATPTTYYNQSISLNCYHGNYSMSGRDAYITSFSSTGTNTTVKGSVCLFYTYASDLSGLSYANFRSNNTGPWLNTTYSALSGTASWCNFTLTLNNTSTIMIIVAWEIRVNDTNNVWASTGTQYVILIVNLSFVLGDSLTIPITSAYLKGLHAPINDAYEIITYEILLKNILFKSEANLRPSGGTSTAKSFVSGFAETVKPNLTFDFLKLLYSPVTDVLTMPTVVEFWKTVDFNPSDTLKPFSSLSITLNVPSYLTAVVSGLVPVRDSSTMTKTWMNSLSETVKPNLNAMLLKSLLNPLGNKLSTLGSSGFSKNLSFQASETFTLDVAALLLKTLFSPLGNTVTVPTSIEATKAMIFNSSDVLKPFDSLAMTIGVAVAHVEALLGDLLQLQASLGATKNMVYLPTDILKITGAHYVPGLAIVEDLSVVWMTLGILGFVFGVSGYVLMIGKRRRED